MRIFRRLTGRWSPLAELESDGAGQFAHALAADPRALIVASHPQSGNGALEIEADAETLNLRVQVRPSQSLFLEGVVVDTDGRAVSGARVEASRGRRERRSAVSDEFGYFRVQYLSARTWRVKVSAPEHRPIEPEGHSITIPFTEGELRLVMAREVPGARASIAGELVDAMTGAPLPNIRFDELFGGTASLAGVRFVIDGVRPGTVQLSTRSPGYESIDFEPLEAAEGAHYELGRREAFRAGRLELRLTDEEGQRIGRARVELQPIAFGEGGAGSERASLRLGERNDGWNYRREDAPLRRWWLSIERKGFEPYREQVELSSRRNRLSVQLVRSQ